MEFKAKLESLSDMLSFIKDKASQLGLPRELIRKVELASEESIVNVISYAYPNDIAGKIEIDCERSGESRFQITIRDFGIPFNPLDLDVDNAASVPIEERKIGGLGIFMIEELMDEVSYKREGDQNVFQMVINLNHSL